MGGRHDSGKDEERTGEEFLLGAQGGARAIPRMASGIPLCARGDMSGEGGRLEHEKARETTRKPRKGGLFRAFPGVSLFRVPKAFASGTGGTKWGAVSFG